MSAKEGGELSLRFSSEVWGEGGWAAGHLTAQADRIFSQKVKNNRI